VKLNQRPDGTLAKTLLRKARFKNSPGPEPADYYDDSGWTMGLWRNNIDVQEIETRAARRGGRG